MPIARARLARPDQSIKAAQATGIRDGDLIFIIIIVLVNFNLHLL